MTFWLVLKLEILIVIECYNNILKDFGFFFFWRIFFEDYIFLHGEIFDEFP